MLKKIGLKAIGLPLLALAGLVGLASPQQAKAGVSFGIGVGPVYSAPVVPAVPAYPYGYSYADPYYNAYPYGYNYGYVAPSVVVPYVGGYWGGHHYYAPRGYYGHGYYGRGSFGFRGGHHR